MLVVAGMFEIQQGVETDTIDPSRGNPVIANEPVCENTGDADGDRVRFRTGRNGIVTGSEMGDGGWRRSNRKARAKL